jgi:hypothetical protein
VGYDDWKTHEGPDPGRSNGRPGSLPLLRCTRCTFRGAIGAAIEHWRDTLHPVAFRGMVQDFSHLGGARALKETA